MNHILANCLSSCLSVKATLKGQLKRHLKRHLLSQHVYHASYTFHYLHEIDGMNLNSVGAETITRLLFYHSHT